MDHLLRYGVKTDQAGGIPVVDARLAWTDFGIDAITAATFRLRLRKGQQVSAPDGLTSARPVPQHSDQPTGHRDRCHIYDRYAARVPSNHGRRPESTPHEQFARQRTDA
ncbi:MAG: hypothetical protein OXU79_14515 [Gemmatimonadota bacterium]|nr:hypothetical protein [Gemmatimonadota bacterium]